MNGGEPVNYVNYSVVLDAVRRMALFSAATLDRQLRVVLPRALDKPRSDPRVADSAEPPPDWFHNGAVAGHLAGLGEIAWGSVFDGDPMIAAQRLAQLTDVYPNCLPKTPDIEAGPWSARERWTVTEHNPSAQRVAIFAGPVFSAGDSNAGAISMPGAYWKVAVSPGSDKSDPASLVVDAFLLPQGSSEPDGTAQGVEFQPDRFRISIAELEKLTGLAFPDAVRAADARRFPIQADPDTPGARLAARVPQLDASDAATRLQSAARDDAGAAGKAGFAVGSRASSRQHNDMRHGGPCL